MTRVRPWDSGPLQVLLGATGVCPFVPGLTLTAALFTVNPDSLSCELSDFQQDTPSFKRERSLAPKD